MNSDTQTDGNKPKTIRKTVSMDEIVYNQAVAQAAKEGRNFSNYVAHLITRSENGQLVVPPAAMQIQENRE